MTICHVNEIREENKTQTPPGILLSMVHLQKLTTVLVTRSNVRSFNLYFILPQYSKDLQKTLRDSSIRPVVNLSVRSPAVDE